MASVFITPKINRECFVCNGKGMFQIYPNVYDTCRECIPYTPSDKGIIAREYTCSACRDSNVSYWATDVSSPCTYCGNLKPYNFIK